LISTKTVTTKVSKIVKHRNIIHTELNTNKKPDEARRMRSASPSWRSGYDVISMTDNEATRTTFMTTRPALHEEDEAEAGCYEAEAENFGLEATLALRT